MWHIMLGGEGFLPFPSLLPFVLRSSLLPSCGFHASFQTCPCHALTPHQVSPPRLDFWSRKNFFEAGLQKKQWFGFNEALWLVETGRETRKTKPVLRRFSGPRIGSVGASCFVDDFVSCWGKGVHIGCCLNPVEVSFFFFPVHRV